MLIAPTEPKLLKEMGQSSPLPEKLGVDYLWDGHGGVMCGVQRKEVKDFLASQYDGRLAQEVQQMGRLAVKWLVLEGEMRWTRDGELMKTRGFGYPWNLKMHAGYLATLQMQGVWWWQTKNMGETAEWLRWMQGWTRKQRHDSWLSRPTKKGEWGTQTSREWAMWVLQSFPGLGPERARRIVERFGGVPLGWTVTVDELQEVEGIGPKLAGKLVKALST